MMILSIICVTLGKRDFEKYLDYILEIDKYELIELIIIDASNKIDNLIKSTPKYNKIKYTYRKSDLKLLECFILGFSLASCNYVMWLNDDDYIINKNFINIVKYNIDNYKDVDVFYGNGYYKDNIKNTIKNAYINKEIENNPVKAFSECYGMLQPATFFKKKLCKYFNQVKYVEIFDVNFFILLHNKKFKMINDVLVEASINNGTITDNNSKKQCFQHLLLLNECNNIQISDKVIKNNTIGILSKKSRLLYNGELENEYLKKSIILLKFMMSKNIFFKNNNLALENINDIKKIEKNEKILEIEFYYYSVLNKILNKKILIIGNGPSTKTLDFKKINKNCYTLGMNCAYRYWDKINWYPTIYACLDPVVIKSHSKRISEMIDENKIKIFFLHDEILLNYPELRNNTKIIFLNDIVYKLNIFNNNMLTTGSYSLRLAMLLGFYKIYFIGIDCKYDNFIEGCKKESGITLSINKKIQNNPNYFFDDYQQEGDKYQIPNVYDNFHLRSINSIYDDILKYNIDIKIYNLSDNKDIKFPKKAI